MSAETSVSTTSGFNDLFGNMSVKGAEAKVDTVPSNASSSAVRILRRLFLSVLLEIMVQLAVGLEKIMTLKLTVTECFIVSLSLCLRMRRELNSESLMVVVKDTGMPLTRLVITRVSCVMAISSVVFQHSTAFRRKLMAGRSGL
jgi:hypothetical protein